MQFSLDFKKFVVTRMIKQTIDAIALKFLPGTKILFKVDRFVYRSENEGFMPNNTYKCKLQRL